MLLVLVLEKSFKSLLVFSQIFIGHYFLCSFCNFTNFSVQELHGLNWLWCAMVPDIIYRKNCRRKRTVLPPDNFTSMKNFVWGYQKNSYLKLDKHIPHKITLKWWLFVDQKARILRKIPDHEEISLLVRQVL